MSVSKQAKLARQHENTWADLHRRVMFVPFDYEELFPKHVHNFIQKKAVYMSSCTGYFVPCLLSTRSFVLGLNSYILNGSRSFPCNMYIMVIGLLRLVRVRVRVNVRVRVRGISCMLSFWGWD